MIALYLIAIMLIAGLKLSWWWMMPLVFCFCLDLTTGMLKGMIDAFLLLKKDQVDKAVEEKSALKEMQH